MRAHEWAPADLYAAYECARDEAALALADWYAAPAGTKAETFTVYRAALDREDAASRAWLEACAAYDAAA
jgi:hypothetical protein